MNDPANWKEFEVKVVARGIEYLERAMCMAFAGRDCVGWADSPRLGLLFFEAIDPDEAEAREHVHRRFDRVVAENYRIIQFEQQQSVGPCVAFAWDWLAQENPSGCLGSSNLGFLVETAKYGRLGAHHGVICQVRRRCLTVDWRV